MNWLTKLFGKKDSETITTESSSSLNDPVDYYQAIASELVEVINEPWEKVEIEALRFEGSIDLKIVYTRPDGTRESRVNDIMIPEYFFDLATVVSTPEKGLYKVCNYVLNNTGKFDVNFEY